MSWTDEELDKLFSDSAGDMTFEYKKEYFKDIEKHLPISRKRDILWNGVSLAMGAIVVYIMMQPATFNGDVSKTNYQLTLDEPGISLNRMASIETEQLSGDDFDFNRSTTSGVSVLPEYNSDIVISESIFKETEINIEKVKDVDHILLKETEGAILLSQNDAEILDQKIFRVERKSTLDFVERIDLTPRTDFFIQGVAGIGQGKMLPGEKTSKLTGIGVGLEYNRNRLSASFALNGVVSHHDGMELSRVSKVYGFGSKEYKSTIEYSKLIMAESELTLGYRMGRITAYGGLNLNYLVTTECSIVNSTDEVLDSDNVRKVYGYDTGLKSWGLKPMIGASYDFKNNLQLGANIGAQVIETVEQEFLEGVSRPMPLEGRFYLRWKF